MFGMRRERIGFYVWYAKGEGIVQCVVCEKRKERREVFCVVREGRGFSIMCGMSGE